MTIEEVQEQNEGCDLAEKTRNYLKKCRQNWGNDFFVLLGGDTNIIPERMASMVLTEMIIEMMNIKMIQLSGTRFILYGIGR